MTVCDRPEGTVSTEPISAGHPAPETRHIFKPTQHPQLWVAIGGVAVGDRIGYARVSTADQDPQLQLDALSAADCLKIYTDTATGTKADRPQRNACLVDLRRGDTLLIWKIDRLGRNLRDLVDIVTTLQTRGVGVRSLTNGIVDTTTAHGSFVFPKDSSRVDTRRGMLVRGRVLA